MVLNTELLDWESSVLTNRPLINHSKKASKHSLTSIVWAVFQQQVLHKVYQINTLIQVLDSEFLTEMKWSWKNILCLNISYITLPLPIQITIYAGILYIHKCKQLDIEQRFKIILTYFIKIIERLLFSDTGGIKITQKLKLDLPHLKKNKNSCIASYST